MIASQRKLMRYVHEVFLPKHAELASAKGNPEALRIVAPLLGAEDNLAGETADPTQTVPAAEQALAQVVVDGGSTGVPSGFLKVCNFEQSNGWEPCNLQLLF